MAFTIKKDKGLVIFLVGVVVLLLIMKADLLNFIPTFAILSGEQTTIDAMDNYVKTFHHDITKPFQKDDDCLLGFHFDDSTSIPMPDGNGGVIAGKTQEMITDYCSGKTFGLPLTFSIVQDGKFGGALKSTDTGGLLGGLNVGNGYNLGKNNDLFIEAWIKVLSSDSLPANSPNVIFATGPPNGWIYINEVYGGDLICQGVRTSDQKISRNEYVYIACSITPFGVDIYKNGHLSSSGLDEHPDKVLPGLNNNVYLGGGNFYWEEKQYSNSPDTASVDPGGNLNGYIDEIRISKKTRVGYWEASSPDTTRVGLDTFRKVQGSSSLSFNKVGSATSFGGMKCDDCYALDLTGYENGGIAMEVFIPEGGDYSALNIIIGSDRKNDNNYYSWSIPIKDLKLNVFNTLNLAFAEATKTGTPNIAKLASIKINMGSLGSTGRYDDIRVDNIRALKTAEGIVIPTTTINTTTTTNTTTNTTITDTDGDGISDATDNAKFISNADQKDTDSDGIGDVIDNDKDGDTILNTADNCPLISNNNQLDTDKDGLGDVCDPTPNQATANDVVAAEKNKQNAATTTNNINSSNKSKSTASKATVTTKTTVTGISTAATQEPGFIIRNRNPILIFMMLATLIVFFISKGTTSVKKIKYFLFINKEGALLWGIIALVFALLSGLGGSIATIVITSIGVFFGIIIDNFIWRGK